MCLRLSFHAILLGFLGVLVLILPATAWAGVRDGWSATQNPELTEVPTQGDLVFSALYQTAHGAFAPYNSVLELYGLDSIEELMDAVEVSVTDADGQEISGALQVYLQNDSAMEVQAIMVFSPEEELEEWGYYTLHFQGWVHGQDKPEELRWWGDQEINYFVAGSGDQMGPLSLSGEFSERTRPVERACCQAIDCEAVANARCEICWTQAYILYGQIGVVVEISSATLLPSQILLHVEDHYGPFNELMDRTFWAKDLHEPMLQYGFDPEAPQPYCVTVTAENLVDASQHVEVLCVDPPEDHSPGLVTIDPADTRIDECADDDAVDEADPGPEGQGDVGGESDQADAGTDDSDVGTGQADSNGSGGSGGGCATIPGDSSPVWPLLVLACLIGVLRRRL